MQNFKEHTWRLYYLDLPNKRSLKYSLWKFCFRKLYVAIIACNEGHNGLYARNQLNFSLTNFESTIFNHFSATSFFSILPHCLFDFQKKYTVLKHDSIQLWKALLFGENVHISDLFGKIKKLFLFNIKKKVLLIFL